MKKSSYVLVIFGGVALGILVIFPVNEAIYFYEHIRTHPNSPTLGSFILDEFGLIATANSPEIAVFYSLFGVTLTFIITRIHIQFAKRDESLRRLSEELGKNILHVIARGEGPQIEFKSSFRWDYQQSKKNRDLEFVVMKTIAGFMNSSGGSLLIGVADDNQILGLEHDYQTLKKPNRDFFEQAIMTSVSVNLGTDLCRYSHVVFHNVDDLDICRVIVSPSRRPAYMKREGKMTLFVRTGGGTRELNVQEAVDYVTAHWPK